MNTEQTSLPEYWRALLKEASDREGISKAEIIREGVMLRLCLGQIADPNGARVLDRLHEHLREASRYD